MIYKNTFINKRPLEDLREILYTSFSIEEKERRLQHVFSEQLPDLEYSREAIEEIFFNEYVSKGGYWPKAFYVRNYWIPEDYNNPSYYPIGSFPRWYKDHGHLLTPQEDAHAQQYLNIQHLFN